MRFVWIWEPIPTETRKQPWGGQRLIAGESDRPRTTTPGTRLLPEHDLLPLVQVQSPSVQREEQSAEGNTGSLHSPGLHTGAGKTRHSLSQRPAPSRFRLKRSEQHRLASPYRPAPASTKPEDLPRRRARSARCAFVQRPQVLHWFG